MTEKEAKIIYLACDMVEKARIDLESGYDIPIKMTIDALVEAVQEYRCTVN